MVQLVDYDGGYASVDATGVVLGSGSLVAFRGMMATFSGVYDVSAGTSVYLRMFNAATVDAADYYVNLGTTGGADYYEVTGESAEGVSFETGFSGITTDTSASAQWISTDAVPEPATAGLLGISAGAIWLIRRLKKASNYYLT